MSEPRTRSRLVLASGVALVLAVSGVFAACGDGTESPNNGSAAPSSTLKGWRPINLKLNPRAMSAMSAATSASAAPSASAR
ncbi:MAG: hypothetical protein U0271_40610 [Polyangiaceae bacterium]